MTAEKLLEKAGANLLFTEPFWATITYQLQRGRVACGPEVCDVAATDGKALYYNPVEVAKLPFGQVRTLLAHEGCHLAFQDHIWMKGKDAKTANIAADHANNLILEAAGFEPIPGWMCDKRFTGMTKDQVYKTLQKEAQQGKGGGGQQPPPPGQKPQKSPPGGQQSPGNGQGQGKPQPQQSQGQPGQQPGNQPGTGQPQAASTPGGFGQIIPCPTDQVTAQQAEWKMAVETAATAAKCAGKLPGYLKKMVEELRESRVDWREILKTFLSNQVPTDFTWARPSKRTLSQSIYLPSQVKEGLGPLVFCVDMSGSCMSYVTPFCSEIAVVQQDMKPSKLTLLSFDTRVHQLGEYSVGEDIEFNMKGGGGTDFRPIFDAIAELESQPKAVVILTDLYGPLPEANNYPDYPTLFVCTTREIAPFGETCHIDL